jgi:uncharacterized protein (TIGR02594 family)
MRARGPEGGIAIRLPRKGFPEMADAAPVWLLEMRAISGLSEKPGEADEPKILAMANFIGQTFPDMASYCAGYKHDATPWCGLAEAYCMAKAGIRPPFRPGFDTDCFLWARSWADDPNYPKLSVPKLGCVVVMVREGGGHVTTYESDAGSSVNCRGGNQSDAVNVKSFPKANVIAYVWPKEGGTPPPPDSEEPVPDKLPMLRKGDTGPSVAYMQSLIPKWIDGEFGPTTEALLEEFQRSKGLEVDGVCGQATWSALGAKEALPPVKPPSEVGWIHAVTATVFGGAADNEHSAYAPYDLLNDTDLYLSLPNRFAGTRPLVEVKGPNGTSMTAEIRDVGPWMTNDSYWTFNKRPTAELCYGDKTPLPSGPHKGKVPSNPAGIDLSPALAKLIGISGKGKVSWRLVS